MTGHSPASGDEPKPFRQGYCAASLEAPQAAEVAVAKPHRLKRNVDVSFVKQVLHIPQQQRETDLHHHRKADDLR